MVVAFAKTLMVKIRCYHYRGVIMYYDNYDYVADNYDAIMAEDCHVQEIKNELEYYEKLLANGDTTHLTLNEIKANIKRIKKILGE